MRIVNFGSANLDHVYRVPHILKPGETLTASSFEIFCGGKGVNQSVALARAGAEVFHAGAIGKDGDMLFHALFDAGVHTDYIKRTDSPSGSTVIQVSDDGENNIIYFPGANHAVTKEQICDTLSQFEKGDMLLCQNEISGVDVILSEGKRRGLTVCFNPSPVTEKLQDLPLSCVDVFLVNRLEAETISGDKEEPGKALCRKFPHSVTVMTVGAQGVYCYCGEKTYFHPAFPVRAVDTTGAGDTFTGYFLAALSRGLCMEQCLRQACAGAALAVTAAGAVTSIPTREKTDEFLEHQKEF